jgi:sugar phosphate isomerase/epimerase
METDIMQPTKCASGADFRSSDVSRRDFLGLLAGGATALTTTDLGLARADATEKATGPTQKVLGAQLYTVRRYTRSINEVRETLKKVARIGYTAVQVSGMGPSIKTNDVAQAVTDAGLTVGGAHVDWSVLLKDPGPVIEELKLYRCQHAAIGGLPPEYYSLEGIKRFLDELTPVAQKLLAEGIDFSYHNHNHELAHYDKKPWLERVYAQSDPKLLNAEIDTHWIQRGGGDPAAWIRRYPGRQPLLHLKDMTITPKREIRFAEIGEGNMNWPAILDSAKSASVRWYLVEQDDCYDRDPFESLAISYRNLRAMGLS